MTPSFSESQTGKYQASVTEMPVMGRVYDHKLLGTHKQFTQFNVPTETIIGGNGKYPNVAVIPTQGRNFITDFKLRPEGHIEPYWIHNDGIGRAIICQEVFEDFRDDGHTDYALVGYRYVLDGKDPWEAFD